MICDTSGFQKNRDIAISLAVQGLSYARAGNWVGCVKSTVGKWLRKALLAVPERNIAAARRVTGVRKCCTKECVI